MEISLPKFTGIATWEVTPLSLFNSHDFFILKTGVDGDLGSVEPLYQDKRTNLFRLLTRSKRSIGFGVTINPRYARSYIRGGSLILFFRDKEALSEEEELFVAYHDSSVRFLVITSTQSGISDYYLVSRKPPRDYGYEDFIW